MMLKVFVRNLGERWLKYRIAQLRATSLNMQRESIFLRVRYNKTEDGFSDKIERN